MGKARDLASGQETFVNASGDSISGTLDVSSLTAPASFTMTSLASSGSTTSYQFQSVRAAGTGFYLFNLSTGTSTDNKFKVRGDGTFYADVTTIGGTADYAEMFEWSDGNPDNEDRVGTCVVLENGKIRKAIQGDIPLGVISGAPAVVADTAWNSWNQKYLKDEFNRNLTEEDGTLIINPEWNPEEEYTPRQERPEWDAVGLMGKLRVINGEIINPNWIKLRDISENVTEWLVK